MKRWRDAIAVYGDRRLLVILLMGFSSGMPLMVTLSVLSYWLARLGINKETIGLFALVGTPYSFKFLWAPLLDQIRPPILGRRRGWALIVQVAMAFAILALGMTDPIVNPWWTAAAAVVVAFLSASQDIVLDAFRIEILPQTDADQGVGASAYQLGYRLGMLAVSAGAIALADFVPWFWVFVYLASLVAVGVVAVLLAPERPPVGEVAQETFLDWVHRGVIAPLVDFAVRRGWSYFCSCCSTNLPARLARQCRQSSMLIWALLVLRSHQLPR
jgi:MFS transporter, PAT family, beta-lactamase induction signal transducer AmpG